MFQGFSDFNVQVESDVTIHGRKGGSGPSLLLLHGFPQNLLIWHDVVDELARTYTVVALDLRGYGSSSKPPGDDRHVTYSKRIMARDCVRVMEKLGCPNFYICSHDRGARVAHKLCVDYPEKVNRVMFLDIAPTAAMYGKTDFTFAKAYYHWFFLIQPSPLPENLLNANPTAFMEQHMGGKYAGMGPFSAECLESYTNMMRNPEAVHAMCEDYRAAASIDLEENAEDERAGRVIKCSVMVLWGQHGVIEKCFDAVEEWNKVSSSSVIGHSLDCGHYIPEERPEALLGKIKEFCVESS